jgi:hypothetical protein
MEMYTMTTQRIQTINISPAHPLALFNLTLSLEWDASQDTAFRERLEADLQSTSAFLYDWTDGQAALGKITLYQNREHWDTAHIRLYATNNLRPNANQGGLVLTPITDTTVPTITYSPGQIRMGARWNRYGDPGTDFRADWPRALAHELGHYLLFLDDNYLGLDEAGQVIPVDSCTGAMADPYREDLPYDEFHPADVAWTTHCSSTLSARTTARADWETILTFYPALSSTHPLSGPTTLPIGVTQIQFSPLTTTSVTLPPQTLSLLSETGARLLPENGAHGVIFQTRENRLIDLGAPVLNHLTVRGGAPGDRICLFDPEAARLGCETLQSNEEFLIVYALPNWKPEIALTPVNSRTFGVSVTAVPTGLSLQARFYPENGAASADLTLTEETTGYSGTFSLTDPALTGYLYLWVEEKAPQRREALIDYTLGGSPTTINGCNEESCSVNYTPIRSDGAFIRGRSAPGVSADGQVIIFGNVAFNPGDFFTLQSTPYLPDIQPWFTRVGKGYRLIATSGAITNLQKLSISFNYLESEVPTGEESWLHIYFWNPTPGQWERLPTRLDTAQNMASAPVQGTGLYALFSSLEIALPQTGWNLLSYPLQESRPVSQALQSIDSYYRVLYGYDAGRAADPWRVYGKVETTSTPAPEWVNDLATLEYGKGYWIYATQPVTWYLKSEMTAQAARFGMTPPAVVFGAVHPLPDFTPTVGMTAAAWIAGQPCGTGILQNQPLDNLTALVYTLRIPADDGLNGCGLLNRPVTFTVGGVPMSATLSWDNSRISRLDLSSGGSYRLYLPLIVKEK